MSLEIHLQDAKMMKTIIDPMIPVGMDLFIEISPNGFRAYTQGIGGAWAADAFLPSKYFDQLSVDGTHEYFIRLKDFADFLSTIRKSDELSIREDDQTKSLLMELKSAEISKKMNLRLLEKPDDFKIITFIAKRNSTGFPSTSVMEVDLFSQAIKAAELGGEEVKITHSPEGLLFEAAGSSTRTAEAKISFDSEKVEYKKFASQTPFVSNFKLEYLKHISKVGRSSDKIEVHLVNNGPMVLIYPLSGESSDIEDDISKNGYIGFAIAPKVKH